MCGSLVWHVNVTSVLAQAVCPSRKVVLVIFWALTLHTMAVRKGNSQLRDKREPRQLLGGQYINFDRYCNDMHVFVMCIDTLHTYQDSTELVH